MRWIPALVLAAAVAGAAPDAARTWRNGTRRLAKEEKRFWDDFNKSWVRVWEAFLAPVMEARGRKDGNPNPLYDYAPFEAWYEDYAAIQRGLGAVDLAFATSGHPKAGPELLKALLAVAKKIDATDKELLAGRPVKWDTFDQHAPIRRYGLSIRLRGLVEALALAPGGADFLAGPAYKQARAKDGHRSIVRRVALLDALGLCSDPDAVKALAPHVRDRESSLRIAALEALVRHGEEGRAAARIGLDDPHPIVRRALLQAIRTTAPAVAGWIPPLVEKLPATKGCERADLLRALEALTRQKFGNAPARWKSWLADYRAEIESGAFDREKIEVREADPAPLPARVTFYGVATPSRRVIFVLDGSRRIFWPADWDVQKTRYKYDWDRTRATWEKEHPSHHAILARELERALTGAPEDLRFGIVTLYGGFVAEATGAHKLLRKRPRDLARARKVVAELPGDGWCSFFAGLLEAGRLAGMPPESDAGFPEPAADTIFLFSNGEPSGGRYLSEAALLDAFRRFNRWRRLVVHTIRICNDGENAARILRGIAEASGGTYVWARKPPEG